MRNIILALTIAFCAAVILYLAGAGLGYLLAILLPGFPADVAKGLAGLPLGGIKGIYEFLETSSAKRASARTGLSQTIPINEFSIHPISAFLLCLITWCGVVLFTGALMGVIIGYATLDGKVNIMQSNPLLLVATAFPLRVIAAAYLGCWIGTRSRRYVFGVLIGSIVLGYSAAFLLSTLMIGNDQFTKLLGEDLTILQRYTTILPDMVIFIIFGALGFWYGQRQKLVYYLAFIMRMLPQEIRQTIVEMARDEAVRAHPTAMQVRSWSQHATLMR